MLQEGFRPGVMEKLGLSPDVFLKRNPKQAYGRMTGWGQEGLLSQAVGHDINYTSLKALYMPSSGKGTWFAINLVGDFGGGVRPPTWCIEEPSFRSNSHVLSTVLRPYRLHRSSLSSFPSAYPSWSRS